MKTNLLLLDSYKNIDNLISFAFSFSNLNNRKLTIAYVFDFDWMRRSYMMASTGPMQANLYMVEKNARKEFEVAETKIKELIAEYKKHNKSGVPFRFYATEMNRISLVDEEMKKDQGLMLIISNHQSYSDVTEGTVKYPNFIESVKCPVLIVPEDIASAVMNNIIYTTDYNPEDVTSLKNLYSFLGESKKSKITVLHNEKDFNFDTKLKWIGFQDIVRSVIPDEKIEFKLKTNGDFLQGVEEFVERNDPDMLAVLHEKKGFFEHVFTSNETRNVLTHFNKPVLVYHET